MQWFWCLTHQRPEQATQRDDPENSLGPYETEAAARSWRELNEERNDAWKEQDEAWFGDDDPTDGGDDGGAEKTV